MARNRKKDYAQGDRINIYLSRDVPPEFIEWINKQSDLSSFFLYAAQKLYQQTGFSDVSEIMPRKINFNLSLTDNTIRTEVLEGQRKTVKDTPLIEERSITKSEEEHTPKEEEEKMEENNKNEAWSTLSDFDDPYA